MRSTGGVGVSPAPCAPSGEMPLVNITLNKESSIVDPIRFRRFCPIFPALIFIFVLSRSFYSPFTREQGTDTVHAKDDDYLSRYTIKKYHSEKIVSDESWVHSRKELLPINTDGYSPIVLDDVENYRVLGVLMYVISN